MVRIDRLSQADLCSPEQSISSRQEAVNIQGPGDTPQGSLYVVDITWSYAHNDQNK